MPLLEEDSMDLETEFDLREVSLKSYKYFNANVYKKLVESLTSTDKQTLLHAGVLRFSKEVLEQLKRTKQKKILGLVIDVQLKWNEWNNEQCKTISKGVALLRRLSPKKDFLKLLPVLFLIRSLVHGSLGCTTQQINNCEIRYVRFCYLHLTPYLHIKIA